MPDVAPQIHTVSTNEDRNVAVSFVGKLDGAEVLTGTPTVTELDTTDLTIASKQVSTAELTINGVAVPIGQAVQFTVDGTTASEGKTYNIDIVCSTDASQTIDGRVRVTIN